MTRLAMRVRRTVARRDGFTIIEIMIAMLMTSILGAALVKTMISSNQFIDRIEAGRDARGSARAALNLLSTELRMVSAGTGIEAATPTSLTMRVAYRVGMACSSTVGIPGVVVATFTPSDTSIASTSLGYTGFASLQSSGEYQYTNGIGTPAAGAASVCTAAPASLTPVAGSSTLSMSGLALPAAIPPGTPVVLWRRVQYDLAPSVILPGRLALWRRQLDGASAVISSEELAAPLEASTRFGFYINNARASSDTVPTSLGDLRGIELRLVGESMRVSRGASQTEQSRLTTAVFFLNRPD